MTTKTLLVLLAGTTLLSPVQAADIVKVGQPNAQIVIAAENRPRMATLAALELQKWIQKISGARLPIVTIPDADMPVKIYVGKSPETVKLGVSDEGLDYGAFRIVSGADWLALVGNDKDFVPTKLTQMKRGDPGPWEEWKRLTAGKTDAAWGFKGDASGFKNWWNPKDFGQIINDYYGEGSAALWKTGGNTIDGFWNDDTAGSVNAVTEFLHGLGVRFYMPNDELGTVIPKLSSIPLPEVNTTLIPDYPCRNWQWYSYTSFPLEEVMWARRLGINDGAGYYTGTHGLRVVHLRPEMKKTHPEYYALSGGKRDTEHHGEGSVCYSSDGFFKETVNFCRFKFDVLGAKFVDLWPGDGLKQCECDKCKVQTPSEMVWGFINRVATELYKTHPDKLVNCGAYSSYRDAPDTIEKFSPNVMVSIYNYIRQAFMDDVVWAEYQDNIEKWRSKLAPGRIRRGENNLYNGSPAPGRRQLISYPIIFPRAVARDLKYLKGVSFGDGAESPQLIGKWKAPGVDHLALYMQARFLMDADQDTDKVLDEYYSLFYGPAAKEMKEAFVYAEDNMATRDKSKGGGRKDITNVSMEKKLRVRELLEKAKVAAGDGIYGERVAKIISELKPKEALIVSEDKIELNKKRAKNRMVLGTGSSNVGNARQYSLVDLKTRKASVDCPTSFKVGYENNMLSLEIVCKEPDMKGLNSSKPVDKGDYVAILLETPFFDSFYTIYISPDGELLEGNPMPGSWWSLAEVKIDKAQDSWTVKVRIPTVDAEEGMGDPNHRVAGEKPTIDDLWFFNVARQRVREGKPEIQAFSKSKTAEWNTMESFGKLEIR